MIIEIELYRGSGRAYYGRLPLTRVLVDALNAEHPGLLPRGDYPEVAERIRFVLRFHNVEDTEKPSREPRLVNMRTGFGHVDLIVTVDSHVVHRAHYTVSRLLGAPLAPLLRRLEPDEHEWGFAVGHPALGEQENSRPAPEVEGSVDIDLRRPGAVPFTVEKIAAPLPEEVGDGDLGIPPDLLGPVNVLLPEAVHRRLHHDLPLSETIEEGGFLLGRVRRAAGAGERLLVEVTHVTPAECSGASAVHFTFTGDSFSAVNRLITEGGEARRLVGWYHTHLFCPEIDMKTGTGLSTTDVDLHFATFRRPGQVAGLINVHDAGRTVRFYGRLGDRMVESAVWSPDEHGRYSLRRPAPDDR
ncbi:hypothetical protein GCM10017673_44590 [Streptosporangium violaceochromogenes]|nr:hypothetical protein GCM10017673_44590 [Streptosporangium violaceochromogenes]